MKHGHQVAHCVGQQIGEGLLCAEDIVVEPADQCPGLRAGEEGQGHALNVAKDLRPHVEDQTLADHRRDAAFGQRQEGLDKRQSARHARQHNDQVGVVLLDPIVDQRPQDQRANGADACAQDDHREKEGEDLLVRNGEGQHAPCGSLLHAMLQDGAVLSQGTHARPGSATPTATHAVTRHAHRWRLPGRAPGRGGVRIVIP